MTKYNGWTNYATWRVNLEMFDGFNPRDHWQGPFDNMWDAANGLKEYAEEVICESAPEGLARDYALTFIQDVNWREIVEHMIEANAD